MNNKCRAIPKTLSQTFFLFLFQNTIIKYLGYTTLATSLNIRILYTYGLSRRVMSVRPDLTQSIIFLFCSSHSTFFSRGRTLGRAAFNAPASATAHAPHEGVYIYISSFPLLRTSIRPRRSFDDYIKVPGLLRMKKNPTQYHKSGLKEKFLDHYTNLAFLNSLTTEYR